MGDNRRPIVIGRRHIPNLASVLTTNVDADKSISLDFQLQGIGCLDELGDSYVKHVIERVQMVLDDWKLGIAE
jgi:hypothetical protein